MKKEYNLSMLFEEGEFDARRGYQRSGSKEAYFSVLHMFILDSGKVLEVFRPALHDQGSIDARSLTLSAARLQGMLTNIGAINLAWNIQRLLPLLDQNYYVEFWGQFREILGQVDKLRNRIISAEKEYHDSEHVPKPAEEAAYNIPGGTKIFARPQRSDFEKLLMLIDNFELESAAKITSFMMRYSYTSDIDRALAELSRALEKFDFAKSLEEAQLLLVLVTNIYESEKHKKKTILAIDDIPSVLLTLEAMLKDKYNIYCITDYNSAVKYLGSNTADLILLDIEMPGIDGFAMMQLFRSIPEYADTPIVFLTGNASDEHIKMAAKLGARDFIKKPVDLTVLHDKLEKALS